MDCLEDTGTVVAVDETRASIQLDHARSASCGIGCGCSSACAGPPVVKVERGDLEQGDRVSVRIPHANAYLAMALIFGLPLALFMVGIAAGQALQGGDEVGAYSVVGGLVGLALAFLIAWLANRAIARKVGPPSVRRLTPESH